MGDPDSYSLWDGGLSDNSSWLFGFCHGELRLERHRDPGSTPGIVVNDLDQAVGMTLSIISHRFVWYSNGCGTHHGNEAVLCI